MKKITKKCYIIIFFIIVITNLINTTYAVEKKNESSLEINFITENNTLPMDNVDISIYQLASFENENYTAKWQDKYSNSIIDLREVTDEEIISKAIQLSEFIKTNNINSDYKLTTDSNGKIKITLENGIYLICGAETIKNNVTYTPMPCIIQIPYTDEEGMLIYNASVELKYHREEQVIPPPTNNTQPEEPENTTPRTGDIISIVVIILLVVIGLNILQILNEKRKKKTKNKK